MGTPEKNYIIETKGSGVGLIDYDNDGWLDIYVVNGSTVDALDRQGNAAARSALPQQPRRNVYRRGGQGRRDQRPLGHGRGHRRLRQRRLAGHLCFECRQEPALPQQSRRHVYRCGGEGRRAAGQLVDRRDLGRLRRRRAAGSVCRRLSSLGLEQPCHRAATRAGIEQLHFAPFAAKRWRADRAV